MEQFLHYLAERQFELREPVETMRVVETSNLRYTPRETEQEKRRNERSEEVNEIVRRLPLTERKQVHYFWRQMMQGTNSR